MVGAGNQGNIVIGQFLVAAVDHRAQFAGIDKQDFIRAVAKLMVGLVARQKPQAGGNHGVVKQLRGQGHHAVHQPGFDHVLANLAFAAGVAVHAAVGQHNPGGAVGAEFMDEVLQPGIVGIAHRRHAVFPAGIVAQLLAAPIADVEGRIGKDKIRFQVGVAVIQEGVAQFQFGVNAANGQVHARQAQGGGVGFLPENRKVFDVALMVEHELFALHEHPAAAAAAVIHAPVVGFEHFHQQFDNAGGRLELAALLAFGIGKLAEEVFIHPAEQVLGFVRILLEANRADQVDQLAQALFVQFRVGVNFGQHAFERRVDALDGVHRVVNPLADFGLFGAVLQVLPAGFFGHEENVVGQVLVRVFGVCALELALALRQFVRTGH